MVSWCEWRLQTHWTPASPSNKKNRKCLISFIRNKVEKATTGTEKQLSKHVHTHIFHMQVFVSVWAKSRCVWCKRKGIPSPGTKENVMQKLWFKVGQNWLQDGRGNKWDSHEKGSQDQGVAHFKAAFSIGIWEWTKPSKKDLKKKKSILPRKTHN